MATTPLPLAATPTADVQIVLGEDAYGSTVAEFGITPAGDLAVVSDTAWLKQDVIIWYLSPAGARPLDPTHGNLLYGLLGQAAPSDPETAIDLAHQTEVDLIARHRLAANAGALSLAGQIDHIEQEQVRVGGADARNDPLALPPGVVQVSFIVVSRGGTTAGVQIAQRLGGGS